MNMTTSWRAVLALGALAALSGCVTQTVAPSPARVADVRAQLLPLLPPRLADRHDWAADIAAAMRALEIEPTTANLCASIAVIEQESGFSADPAVPNLATIARAEIDKRAARLHVPQLVVRAALRLDSPSGKSYGERLAAVRTERQLSRIYEDMIGELPLGQRLFGDANPVRTGGAMQVSITFAEQHAREHDYPYANTASIRHEVFTRRGGIYFGIAHLLGYRVDYAQMLFRFADFNAGWYASRNAAFQQVLSLVAATPLALDGDLVLHGDDHADEVSATERAARSLAQRLDLSHAQIHRALAQGDTVEFERSSLYQRVFALAQTRSPQPLPRAVIPRITLHSPKITRTLTTQWFATRVDQRYQRCLAKAVSSRVTAPATSAAR